jgi:hypothetical protein
MSRSVLTSGTSYTNTVTAPTGTNVLLNNGDGDIIVRAADELKLVASTLSIKLDDVAQAGQVLMTDGTRCSWQSPPKQDLQDVTAQGSTTNNNLVVSKDGKSATYKNDSMVFNNAMNLGATSIKLKAASSIWLDGDLLDSNGASGSSGNVLTKVGNGHEWTTPTTSSTGLDAAQVQIGTTSATTSGVILGRTGQTVTCNSTLQMNGNLNVSGQTVTCNAPLQLNGNLNVTGSLNGGGLSGQVLTSTGTGVIWSAPTSFDSAQVNIGTTSATTSGVILGRTGQTVTCNSNLKLTGTLIDITNNVGTSGQVLSSTVTGVKWQNPIPSSTITTFTSTFQMTGAIIPLNKAAPSGIFYIPRSAGANTGRVFNLPSIANLPIGFNIHFTNLSPVPWIVSTNNQGVIISSSTYDQSTAPTTLTVANGTTNLIFTFYGDCSDGSTLKTVWACNK